MTTAATHTAPTGVILGSNATRLWGMTANERLRRGFLRVGVSPAVALTAMSAQGGILLVSSDWHPPFWWWAWVVGLAAYGIAPPADQARVVLLVILGGYVLQRGLAGLFMQLFGTHINVWRRFDTWFRLYTARRNPNLVILTAATLVGRPDIGIVLVAAWTLLSLLVHSGQIVQWLLARRLGPLKSWLKA